VHNIYNPLSKQLKARRDVGDATSFSSTFLLTYGERRAPEKEKGGEPSESATLPFLFHGSARRGGGKGETRGKGMRIFAFSPPS